MPAVGYLLLETGGKDRQNLFDFLERYAAATMPRVMLHYAIEHLDDDTQRDHYLNLKRSKRNAAQLA